MNLSTNEKLALIDLTQSQVYSLDHNEYATAEDYDFWNTLLTKLQDSKWTLLFYIGIPMNKDVDIFHFLVLLKQLKW